MSSALLHSCGESGDVDGVRRCLDGGADVNASDRQGRTPLYLAVREAHVTVARVLLDRAADVDRANLKRTTPLYVACLKNHLDAVRLLLLEGGAGVDLATRSGRTPLFAACAKGHVDAARLCLNHGAEVDRALPGGGDTPLAIACKNSHIHAARLCLDRGADVNRAQPNGYTALHITCVQGRVDLARLLLTRGADHNRLTNLRLTFVAYWRRAGVHVHTRADTPRQVAGRCGHATMAAWLARITQSGGWRQHWEPRYALVVLRALALRAEAQPILTDPDTAQLSGFLFPGPRPTANSRARRQPRLPNALFPRIVRYYWGDDPTAAPPRPLDPSSPFPPLSVPLVHGKGTSSEPFTLQDSDDETQAFALAAPPPAVAAAPPPPAAPPPAVATVSHLTAPPPVVAGSPPPAPVSRLEREIEAAGGPLLWERFAPLFPEDADAGLASLAARDPAAVDAVLAQSGAKMIPLLRFKRLLEAARA